MPTVYILQESKSQDFSDVRRFGDPKVIIVGHPGSTQRMIEKIQDTILREWTDGDYLVPNGSPLGLLAAGYIFATMNVSKIYTLLWNRSELKYELFRWDFPYDA